MFDARIRTRSSWLIASLSVASSLALAPAVASAEPGILYVPDEDVSLSPAGVGGCSSSESSATGCTPLVAAPTVVPPYAGDLGGLVASLQASLEPFDVHVTQERPPSYVPYTMLLPSNALDLAATDYTCTEGAIACGADDRNGIITTSGGTVHCSNPDPLHASLYAFGRASGLEGTADATDAMHYVPQYMMPLSSYADACAPIAPQIGFDAMGAPVPLPLECAAADHVGCPAGQQNSHAELLARYGARTVDLDPPQLSNITPMDGQVFVYGDGVVVDVDVSDADPAVGLRWIISSPALAAVGIAGGQLSMCTNGMCQYQWPDANPLKPTGSDWAVPIGGLPVGDYTVTLEVSDFHGNVAPMVTFGFEVSWGGFGSDSGGWSTSGGWESDGWGSSGGGWSTGGWGTSGGWGTGVWGSDTGFWGSDTGVWGSDTGVWGSDTGVWGTGTGGWSGTTDGETMPPPNPEDTGTPGETEGHDTAGTTGAEPGGTTGPEPGGTTGPEPGSTGTPPGGSTGTPPGGSSGSDDEGGAQAGDDGGCSCRADGDRPSTTGLAMLVLLGVARRRRRARG